MLPNLLIIGAQKAGTTSLHWYLDLHPDVAMAKGKELDFFAGPGWRWERGLDWYESQFTEPARIVGESSPSYTAIPYVHDVPKRIKSILPEVKLIYVVRDPVDRLLSEYLHLWSRGIERRPFEEIVSHPGLASSGYVTKGLYQLQLEPYLAEYPASRILVLAQEDLLREREATVRRAYRFLGIDESFTSALFDAIHNPARDYRAHRAFKRWLARAVGQRLADAFEYRLVGWRRLESMLTRELRYPALDASIRARLAYHFSADVERFRRTTGQSFGSWSV